jgi:hypothetical protein
MSVLIHRQPRVYHPTAPVFPFEGSAGLRRGTVRVECDLDIDGTRLGQLLPGSMALAQHRMTARLRYLPDRTSKGLIVVYLHHDQAGSFHGLGQGRIETGCGHRDSMQRVCRRLESDHPVYSPLDNESHAFVPGLPRLILDRHPGLQWEASSISGGGAIHAAVVVLPPDAPPLTISTSGYLGRRDWRVHTITSAGEIEVVSESAYLAARSPERVL